MKVQRKFESAFLLVSTIHNVYLDINSIKHRDQISVDGIAILAFDDGTGQLAAVSGQTFMVLYQILACKITLESGIQDTFMTWGEFNDVHIAIRHKSNLLYIEEGNLKLWSGSILLSQFNLVLNSVSRILT